MNKDESILVINTPKSCQMCKLCNWNIYDEAPSCKIIGTLHKADFIDSINPQCPLSATKPLLEGLNVLIEDANRPYLPILSNNQRLLGYNKLYSVLSGDNNE